LSDWRPMRPNPLMPTRTDMEYLLDDERAQPAAMADVAEWAG